MPTIATECEGPITKIGRLFINGTSAIGELTLFFLNMLGWLVTRLPRRAVLLLCMYQIGVESLLVVMVTGGFIGMVMAVQSYDQFRFMHLETNLGAVINVSLVKELGPVLAATMLAGRVGSSMAAELGTMKITEQIDALRVLGANPIHYLVVPRFLGCVLLIPL
ncbi:MAG TPA: ABC transporter permease, partial [Planctomycetaceae bacterium]